MLILYTQQISLLIVKMYSYSGMFSLDKDGVEEGFQAVCLLSNVLIQTEGSGTFKMIAYAAEGSKTVMILSDLTDSKRKMMVTSCKD